MIRLLFVNAGTTPSQQANCSFDGLGSGTSCGERALGSGQGSGSGNEDLARRSAFSFLADIAHVVFDGLGWYVQPWGALATMQVNVYQDPAAQTHGRAPVVLVRRQLHLGTAQLLAPDAAAVAAQQTDSCDHRRSSNGNSGIGNAPGNPAADVQRDVRNDSMMGTAQGTRETCTNIAQRAASLVDAAQQLASSPTVTVTQRHLQHERHDSTTSGSAPVGFRAWVSQPPAAGGTCSDRQSRPSLIGVKRKASCGLPPPPPPLRTMPSSAASTGRNTNLSSLPAPSPRMQQFSSCGNTAGSDATGTHFGNSGLDGSVTPVVSSAFKRAAPYAAPHAAVLSTPPHQPRKSTTSVRPPPSLLSVEQPARDPAESKSTPRGSEASQHVARTREPSLDDTHRQQKQQTAAAASAATAGSCGGGGSWNRSFAATLQQQLHQLQTHQSQQQQMNAQFRNACTNGNFQFGEIAAPLCRASVQVFHGSEHPLMPSQLEWLECSNPVLPQL